MKKYKTGSTINGKPLKITDSWDKMNFGQYLRILKLKDDNVELISILTGLEYDLVKNAKLTGFDNLLYLTRFLNTPPEFPTKITHIGPYKLPLNKDGVFDVQFESLAQFEDLRQIMNTKADGIYAHTEAYAKYCAIYCQKLRDGDYDGHKAMSMVEEIMAFPASQVITAGGFFFVKLTSLLNGIAPNSQNIAQSRKKSIGKRFKKSSGRTRRLIKSRGR